VARCIMREVKAGRGSPHGGVFLDIAWIKEKLPNAEEHIKKKLPSMYHQFKQLADIDITTMTAAPRVELSTSAELLLRLRWLAILHGRVRPSLVVTGGVAAPEDAIKAILAGADAVQVVSAILRHGPEYFATLRAGVAEWMARHQIAHIDNVRGRASLKDAADPAAFERAHYIRTLHSWKI